TATEFGDGSPHGSGCERGASRARSEPQASGVPRARLNCASLQLERVPLRTTPARIALLIALALGCGEKPPPLAQSGPTAEWSEWGGTKSGIHYSPLTQIGRTNVRHLEIAWVHHSGDVQSWTEKTAPTAFQVTPLVVNGSLYYCTPFMRVFSLDPETGKEK